MPLTIIENGAGGTLPPESILAMKQHYCIYMKKISNRTLHDVILKGGDAL